MRFAFDVMASGKEFCNRQDVIGLVSLLHSEKARVKDTTNTLMGIMDPHNRDKVSFETFRCAFLGACRTRKRRSTTHLGVPSLFSAVSVRVLRSFYSLDSLSGCQASFATPTTTREIGLCPVLHA